MTGCPWRPRFTGRTIGERVARCRSKTARTVPAEVERHVDEGQQHAGDTGTIDRAETGQHRRQLARLIVRVHDDAKGHVQPARGSSESVSGS